MSILYAIILGIIQGVTEFLPISSSGHLVLVENLLNIDGNIIFFDLMLHIGTLFAVVIFYRKTICNLIKNPFSKKTLYLTIATIPTVIIALVFKDFFESAFSGHYLVIGFLITAIFLTGIQTIQTNYHLDDNINCINAFIIGVFQGLSILPGISRSGSTITAAITQGVNKKEATEFSFLLSIPVIAGSAVVSIFDIAKNNVPLNIQPMSIIAGIIFSFFSGMFAIKFMTGIIRKNRYYIFVIYLLLLSIVTLLLQNII